MSHNAVSRTITLLLVVFMVTSTITPVVAVESLPTATGPQTAATESFDFSDVSPDQAPAPKSVGAGNLNPSVTLPDYAQPDLDWVSVDIASPTTNENGTIKLPVRVTGQYKDGQYPWQIPVSVTVNSGSLSETDVVYLTPGSGSNDYTAKSTFTLQYTQAGDTTQTVSVTAESQVGDRDADTNSVNIVVQGASDESRAATSGQIRNNDLSELPSELSHVSRYKATTAASGYLEDGSLPVGRESRVTNFANARDANTKHATFQSVSGDMEIGTVTDAVPNGSTHTLVIQYRALENDDVTVTPVYSSGIGIDRTYTLPANPDADARCHEGTGTDTDICIFRLSDLESSEIGAQNELVLKYESNADTALAVFCQDVITGGMPDTGTVCGMGNVDSYQSARIVDISAREQLTGDTAYEGETLRGGFGNDVYFRVFVENRGNIPYTGTVSLESSSGVTFANQTITLAGGAAPAPVVFGPYSIESEQVRFTSTFGDSSAWVDVRPDSLADNLNPESVPGAYVVPIGIESETKTLSGIQQQTLSERPGSDWERVRTLGSSGGTDNWTTYANRLPVIGTFAGLETSSDNITYMNGVLATNYPTVRPTIQTVYGEQINNAKRQLPSGTSPSDWTLEDIIFTTKESTERKIATERPVGYGWERVDEYGVVYTGDFETAKFRGIANESPDAYPPTVIDSEGSGWVKQDNVPPERRLVGYEYNETHIDPNTAANESGWVQDTFVETKRIELPTPDGDIRYIEDSYDPGGNWTYIGRADNGTYMWVQPQYTEVDVYNWRKPVYDWFYTYERPVTTTSYEWERDIYNAEFIFERSAATGTTSLWEGPQYAWVPTYETERVTLNGTRSYDRGGGNIASYQWTFDSGLVSERSAGSGTFTKDYTVPFGVYTPELTVWDTSGNSDTQEAAVHVVPEPLDCQPSCSWYSTIPALSAEATRDHVDYFMEDITYRVDFAGQLNEREWVIRTTAPTANPEFSQQVWRGYDIVDGEEEIYSSIDPRKNGLGPGEVNFTVTATPVGESDPAITDTFTVYICDATNPAFSQGACNDRDPDNDNTPNSGDSTPYVSNDDNPTNNTTSDTYAQSVTWNTVDDWRSSSYVDHVTLLGEGRGDAFTITNQLRIGYERDVAQQEARYNLDSSRRLVAFYDMERNQTAINNGAAYVYDFDIISEAPNSPYMAYIFADTNPENRDGISANDFDAWTWEASRDAPGFGRMSGVFGTRGVEYLEESSGYIEFISPRDTTPNGDPRAGTAMRDEFGKDYSVSYWMLNFRDTVADAYEPTRAGEKQFIWTMQQERSLNVDRILGSQSVVGPAESQNTFGGTDRVPTQLHATQRYQYDTFSGTSFDLVDTWEDDATVQDVPGTNSRVKIGGELVDESIMANQLNYYHHVYVVGSNNIVTGKDSSDYNYIKHYVNGQLLYARSYSDVRSESGEFGLNFGSSEVNRLIWGAGWGDISGPNKFLKGFAFDNIRFHNYALSESQVQDHEYIDNHGELHTTTKWFDSSRDAYTVLAPQLEFEGVVEAGQEVEITVIPIRNDAPDTANADTVTITSSRDTPKLNLGSAPLQGAQIQLDLRTDNTRKSPRVNTVTVGVMKEDVPPNNEEPVARLFTDATSDTFSSGRDVRFIGSESRDYDGSISSYDYQLWRDGTRIDRSSGSVLSGSNIPDWTTSSFTCSGNYEARLNVVDNQGAVDTDTKTFTVDSQMVNADAGNNKAISPGESVTLDASGSSDPDGTITRYEWHIEHVDTRLNGQIQSWTYNSPGTYYVTLTVEDDACQIATDRIQIVVNNQPPTADAGPDAVGFIGSEVQFDGRGSSDPDGQPLTYEWDIDNDGVYELSGATPTHNYASEGTRTVTLRVSDGYGGVDTDTMVIDIYDDSFTGAVGETGTISVTADSFSWQTVNFDNTYTNPVLITKPISSSDTDPAHIRVRNVNGNSAEVQVEEWEGAYDGNHGTATVHYVVMEEGSWILEDGTQVEVGTQSVGQGTTEQVVFNKAFKNTPVVFTQSQTMVGGDPIVTRNDAVTASSFYTMTQEQEEYGVSTPVEDVGYIAIEQGQGTTNGINFEAYTECDCFTDATRQISFLGSYGSDRNIVLDFQTLDGGDTASLRWDNFNSGSIDVVVEEETTADPETGHTTESVGYWVFDRNGDIVALTEPKYRLTSTAYDSSYDGNLACESEFGSSYSIASWQEIHDDFDVDSMKMRTYFDSTPESGGRTIGRVTYRGNQWQYDNYAWWVSHEPDRFVDNPGAYVADGTNDAEPWGDNQYLWVGRWTGNYRVMCSNPTGTF